MGRKVPTQVHHAATRLIQGKLLSQPPLWYNAVAQFPPLPLPPRQAVKRSAFDLPTGAQAKAEWANSKDAAETSSTGVERLRREAKPKTMPIVYLEDKVRRRFFLDHPFEAFRPRSLVEQRQLALEHPVQGKEWTRLRQRGRNPNSEDCINFAVSLHLHHNLPLSQAYRTACQQYAALRSEHTVASHIAYLEAKAYGAVFSPSSSEIRRGFELEEQSLKRWNNETDQSADAQLLASKRWKPVVEKRVEDVGGWTRGEDYVHKYKSGQPPTYAPPNPSL